MLSLLITLLIASLIVYVIFWGLGQIAIPEPFGKIIKVIIVVIIVVWLLSLLTPFLGLGHTTATLIK
jgi:hypothetical protein